MNATTKEYDHHGRIVTQDGPTNADIAEMMREELETTQKERDAAREEARRIAIDRAKMQSEMDAIREEARGIIIQLTTERDTARKTLAELAVDLGELQEKLGKL